MDDIDDIIFDEEEGKPVHKTSSGSQEIGSMHDEDKEEAYEKESDSSEDNDASTEGKQLVGRVAQFFDKIKVAAIELTGTLSVGDIIEIGSGIEAFTMVVSSMQINKESVESASVGDDIGIKVDNPVRVGASVYIVKE
jgi:hypothetical protein